MPLELLNKDFVYMDGGMGTMLIKRGMIAGQRSDMMNIEKPDVVFGIQREYVEAGSEILCSNSFSSCSEALEGTGVTAEEMITAAINIAKIVG